MATSCFIEGEWLSLGKKWGDVPPKVKRAATQIFAVPKYVHQQLLPSPKLSIHQFIDFPLPKHVTVVCVKDFVEGNDDLAEDGTDIPVDVIVAQIVSGNLILVEGFKCDNEGVIVRTGVAEETEVVHDEFVGNGDNIEGAPLGRGHRAKMVPSRYGTNAAWEEY